MYLLSSNPPPRRSGVILLIVVVMLALFLVVGLSFMLYAESEASASRIYREAFTVNYDRADVDANVLLQWALGQLIYDVEDISDGVYSAMRGHSLARNMYGWNYTPKTLTPPYTVDATQNYNIVPFNGYGKLESNVDPKLFAPYENRLLLNHTYFPNYSNPSGSFIRDPERGNPRQSGGDPMNLPFAVVTSPFTGGWNPPYTFPDHNSVFLAAIKANNPYPTGSPQVMMQSFHRPFATPFDAPLSVIRSTDPATNPWLNQSTTSPTMPVPAALKYMVLRPRPADMFWDYSNPNNPHNFPLPASTTGDVQNLPGGNGNDSIWMDLGYPVQTTRGGSKFKPLFAFLVVDLDGRVNLNVHGNEAGTQSGQLVHVSNQGVGKDEVNLRKVLNGSPNPTEVHSLFAGNTAAGLEGRYGLNGVPGGTGTLASPIYQNYPLYQNYPPTKPEPLPPYLTRMDFDGIDENGQPTQRFQLPSNYQTLPNYNSVPPTSPSGYDNLLFTTTAPVQRMALLNNVLNANRPGSDDKPFSIGENLYYLLGAASGPNHQRSYLYRLGLTNNLDQPRIRHMTTVLSNDLDVAGARPWVTDPASSPFTLTQPGPNALAAEFQPRGQNGFPLTQLPSKLGVARNAWQPGTSDFVNGDGRTFVLPRLDLNRKLAPYPTNIAQYTPTASGGALGPPPPPGTVPNATTEPYYRAVWERQKFAAEIFDRLVHATGASPSAAAGSPEYNARRYLAQLAVNIVDYIDDDEFSTPYFWDSTQPNEVVYGVESPRLVLNEVYSEIRNDKNDTGIAQTLPFQVHFWLELFNPRRDAQLSAPTGANYNTDVLTGDNRSVVQLKNSAGDPIYRVQIFDETMLPPNTMRTVSNNGGTVTGVTPTLTAQDWDQTVSPGPLPAPERIRVRPIDQANPNFPNGQAGTAPNAGQNTDGFYVVASDNDIEGVPPKEPTNRLPSIAASAKGLSYTVPEAQNVPAQPPHTILLQRLLCPHLRANPAPDGTVNQNWPYNPYITVDYVSNVQVWDAVRLVQPPIPGAPGPHNPPQTPDQRFSKARKQPLAATDILQNTGPAHTFFDQNSGNSQFDWLVHLDRPPISLGELLHVSGFKPHEITQTFVEGANKFQHVAPWQIDPVKKSNLTDQSRLYRALEYFTVGDRSNWSSYAPGTPAQFSPPSSGGRRPGMINVNTVWDLEVLQALTDAQQSNSFTEATDVASAWAEMNKRRRQPLVAVGSNPPEMPSPDGFDHPFMSLANPGPDNFNTPPPSSAFPTKPGVAGTFLGGDFKNASGGQHPYLYDEMMTKIANHVTTRSNVFAVYLTVGFFEVVDDTVRPVKLGAEIRTRNGLPIRHKMFSVVDRTQLAIEDPRTFTGAGIGTTQGGVDAAGNPKTQFFVTSIDGVAPEERLPNLKTSLSIVGGMSFLNFFYDGKPISFGGNTFTMYADVGTQQETLQGCSIDPTTGNLIVPSGFQRTHAPGFTLSYLMPGNPGPQGPIDYSNPRYSQVIPYTVIIQ